MDIKWVEGIAVFTHPGVRFYREHDNPEHVKVIRVDEIEAFFREGKPAYSTERIIPQILYPCSIGRRTTLMNGVSEPCI
ncbi:MAG: hypothetical protein NTU69_12565 [Proteobacteria bacterium]|nr:hypothetical protein [Pseudomonadota bacterium]